MKLIKITPLFKPNKDFWCTLLNNKLVFYTYSNIKIPNNPLYLFKHKITLLLQI